MRSPRLGSMRSRCEDMLDGGDDHAFHDDLVYIADSRARRPGQPSLDRTGDILPARARVHARAREPSYTEMRWSSTGTCSTEIQVRSSFQMRTSSS